MNLPDYDEIAEDRCDQWASENVSADGNSFRCPDCEVWRPWSEALQSSPSPYALPICRQCMRDRHNNSSRQ